MRRYRYWSVVTTWACVLLVVLIAGIVHVDNVCGQRTDAISKQQVDTLDQIMELRQELDSVELMVTGSALAAILADEDRDFVTRIVMAEARGDGFEGMAAVAQVIKDRSALWGMTPTEVVTVEGQFAKAYRGEISETARWAVKAVFDYDYRIIEEPVTHFCGVIVEPYWADGKEPIELIGNHKFYK